MAVNKQSPFLRLVQAKRKGDSIPAMDIVRNINLSATLSKLIPDNNRPIRDIQGNRQDYAPDIGALSEISYDKIEDINHADTVMQLLPDTEICAQILVSSILSPKDMGETTLTYNPPTDVLPSKTASSLVNIIKDYFKENYKIEPKLQEWLRAILFEKGSYPIAVIPENSLDELITSGNRVSMEALSTVYDTKASNMQPIGLLGKPDKVDLSTGKIIRDKGKHGLNISLEQYDKIEDISAEDGHMYVAMEKYEPEYSNVDKKHKPTRKKEMELFDPCITVTDNPAVLSISSLKEQLRAHTVNQTIFGMESNVDLNDTELENLIYRKMQYQTAPIVALKTSEQAYRESVGEPLILHIPSEAIIPVFIPGSPSQHVGYYVLLDDNGYPISKESNIDHYQELGDMTASGKRSMAGIISQRVHRMFEGPDYRDYNKARRLDASIKAYADMVEKDLLSRLRNGIYGRSIKIGNTTEVFRIMFSRSLAQQHTQILFIPAEMMTYMAFRYDDNGVGVSLLDNLKIINSLRVALMLAGVRSSVMNSIPRTKVNVKLDPNDPNPIKRRDQFVHEYRNLRSSGNNGMPMGTTNPAVIEQWANQAGVEFSWSGHPDIPDMEVDISEYASSVAQPDTDLRDQMDKIGVLGIGLTPEVVDSSKGADFATTITHNNLLLTRRVGQYQEAYNPQISAHIRKHTLASPMIKKDLMNILMNDFVEIMTYIAPDEKTDFSKISPQAKWKLCEKLLSTFVNKLEVTLPKPNSLPLKTKQEAFEEYMNSIDESMKYVLSTDVLPEGVIGELNQAVDMAVAVARSHFAREWMMKNDYMTELLDLLATDEKGEPIYNLWELNAQYSESKAKALALFIDKVKDLKRTGDQYMQSNQQDDNMGGSDYSSDTSGDTDSNSEDSGDDFGMGDDFGGGMGDYGMTEDTGESNSEDNNSDIDEQPADS